jgi:fibronectin type 3 domain-containing protein
MLKQKQLFGFCVGYFFLILFTACKEPISDPTIDNPATTNPEGKTQVKFTNLEQYKVVIYGDPQRNIVLTEIPGFGEATIEAEPKPGGTAFYPTFYLDLFGKPGITIPCDAQGKAALIIKNQTTLVTIPKLTLEDMEKLNSAYIEIVNDSQSTLILREGNDKAFLPKGNYITIINENGHEVYEISPGDISRYALMANVITPVQFPQSLTEFRKGIIYVMTYNGTSIALEEKSVLQTIPSAIPENIQAEIISSDSVRITWNAVYGATSYRIYRATSSASGIYNQVANTTAVSWTDTGLTIGQIYYYKVSAISGVNMESAKSAEVFAVMPTGSVWANTVSDNSISLAWIAVSGANGYNVYRSDSEDGTYTKINSNTITIAEFTDTGLEPLTEYYYKISAIAYGLEGLLSSMVFYTTLMPAPGNVRMTSVTDNSTYLVWDTVNGANGYNIYRSNNLNETYVKINSFIISSVSYSDMNLSSNKNYYYKVSAITGSIESAFSNIVSCTTLLPAPGNLRVIAITDVSVSVEWNAVSGANGYNVYRFSNENGTYTKVNSSLIIDVSYNITGLTQITGYFYIVCAVTGGVEGIKSSIVSCTTLMSAPGNFRVTSVTDNSVNLAWDTVSGASGYNIYRSDSENGTYTKLNSSAIPGVSYSDTSLSSNTKYYYKTSVINGGVESVLSNAVSGITLLSAPGNLHVISITDVSVSFEWNTVSGASGYNIYRSGSENGTYTKVTTSAITAVTYTNTGLSPTTNYFYKVFAVTGGVEGMQSSIVSCTTLMSAPGNFRVTSVTDNSVNLAWNAVSEVNGYNIYRSSNVNGTYTKLNSSMLSDVSYTDTNLSSNTNYYYKVSVITGGVESVLSGAVSGTTLLPAPDNLRVITVTDVSISLEWNTVSGASGYNLYRSASENGAYTKVNSSIITTVSYTNTGLSSTTNYYYKVCAVTGGVDGMQSSFISCTTLMSAPGNFRVTSATDNSINLAWNAITGASGYNIYRSIVQNGTYTKLNTSIISVVSYSDTSLSSNTNYYYKVCAVSSDGVESVMSTAVSGTTLLSAPINLRVITVTDVSVSLEWNTLNGANGYNIYRSGNENGTYTKVNTTLISAVSYTNTGISPDTNYYYKVSGVSSGSVEGVQTSAVSAVTLMPAPSNMRVTSVTDSSMSLAWNTVNGANGYNIYRSNSENGTYSKINSGTLFVTEYTDNVSPYTTTYYYKASAVFSGGIEGMLSNIGSVMVLGSDLTEKLTWLRNNTVSNSIYIIELDSDAPNVSSFNLSYSGNNNIKIFLRGNGGMRTITLSGIIVGSGVTLILDNNISIKRGSNNDGSLVYLDGGTLIMNTGVKINNNNGGGVFLYSGATFTMNGGEIYGNNGRGVNVDSGTFTMNGGRISDFNFSNGGGVYMSGGTFIMNDGKIFGNTASWYGGGVYVNANGAIFTMNGGEISGNTSDQRGGGVYIEKGIFTMNDGKISCNTTNFYGGGIGVNSGTFTMNGGEISGNIAHSGGGVNLSGGTFTMNNGEISGNAASSNGGGVYVSDTGANFIMLGGRISDNTVTSSSGGGVYISRGIFIMEGGEIFGNTASTYGGGVSGTFTMNGGKISNNTAQNGGGVAMYNMTFTMNNGIISNNTAQNGGGVYIRGTFHMSGGAVYGTNASIELKNTATNGAVLYKYDTSSLTQYGILNGNTFNKSGDLSTTDNTIRVVNGSLLTE